MARTIRATGSPAFRLERVVGDETEPLADREKEVGAEVERILGLDYDAFVRSVVLPQGQFDAFLKGKPEERRKILVALLNLKVYEDMHGLVNRRSGQARAEADFLARQLGADFAGQTPARLNELEKDLAEAERTKARLETARQSLAEALAGARHVRDARRDVQRLEGEAGVETGRAAAAGAALDKDTARHEALAVRARELDARVQATGFDDARLVALAAVKPRAEQLADLEPRLQKLEKDQGAAAKALDARRAERKMAEASLPDIEAEARRRQEALEAAREERDGAQRRHAAHALRQHLAKGEPCPVCEQVVRTVPGGRAPALEGAEKAVRAAETAARAAAAAAEQARIAVERLRADVAAQEKHVEQLEDQRAQAASAAEAAREAVSAAGFAPGTAVTAKQLLQRVAGELDRLRSARAERDRIDTDRKALDAERARNEAALATARAQAQAALARLEELRTRQATAQQSLDSARKALLARARKEGWGALEEPLLGRDELDVLEQQLDSVQTELTRASTAAVRLLGEAERMRRDIARAAELLERKKALDEEAALAGQLAQHLQANQFIAYVQEEALGVLAADGSQHLLALSQGRYSLGCRDQDFYVADHWNADRERSVKTLSGGETFLASLALALALAERLADLAAEGRAGDRLESLFLDEGFGTLDAETLDLVVQAIETLQGGNRLVGVITHINELAERLPARVVVSGGQGVPAALSIAS